MFHLAIPSENIEKSIIFYEQLDCDIGRTSDQFAIVNFHKTQLVCHKVETIDGPPMMYPRHFGLIISKQTEFYKLYARAKTDRLPFFEDLFVRYHNKPEEHHTFFLQDPSNNLIEFKWYKNRESIFG